MRIAVIGPSYPFRGGIAHYTTLLVHHLRQRHEVRFLSYIKQYPEWLYPGNTNMDPSPDSSALKVENERILTPMNPLTWWCAFQKIKNDRPDLLILQWWTPFWTPLLFVLTRLIRRFTTIRILFLCHHIIAPDGGMIDWFLARRVLWRGHAFIVMSEDDYAFLRRALPWAHIKGSYLPPYDVFSRQPMPREEARAQLGLNNSDPVLLFFGFVRRYKGLRYLINALATVRKELPARLLIVGEFWEEERPYRDLIRQLGLQDVVQVYNSYIPNEELNRYFSAADVVVLPYLEATQSAVTQVALGFEKPIIATSVGGMAESIHHEKTGLIVPPADVDALSEAIVRFFREGLAEPFGENIRQSKETASWLPLIDLIEEMAHPAPAPQKEQPSVGTPSPRVL